MPDKKISQMSLMSSADALDYLAVLDSSDTIDPNKKIALGALASYIAGIHNHDTIYYTKTQIDAALASLSSSSHTHDDRYFTEAEVTSLLLGKADTGHTHPSQVPRGMISGLYPKWLSSNTIQIGAGSITADDGSETFDFPNAITVDLSGTVGAINSIDATRSASNFYYIWAVKGSAGVGFVASLNYNTPPALPSGYTKKRLLPFDIYNDSSNLIWPFDVSGWGSTPSVRQRVKVTDSVASAPAPAGLTRIVSNNTLSGFQTQLATFTPPISRTALLIVGSSATSNVCYLRTDSATDNARMVITGAYAAFETQMALDSSRQFQYQRSSGYIYIDNIGHVVDNMP